MLGHNCNYIAGNANNYVPASYSRHANLVWTSLYADMEVGARHLYGHHVSGHTKSLS